jgi:retinol dehydrogenase 14
MIALVTGATDGIGKETARQLSERGWRVLVHGRTRKKAEAVGLGEPVWGDFSSLAEVRALAAQVSGDLDVLINNAGILSQRHHVTSDGFEETLQVNHLAPFLLTHLLLPQIRGRIVNVSSGVHGGGDVSEPFEQLNELDGYAAYAASKLANLLFTFALARRVKLPVDGLHPGVISTKLLHAGFGMGGAGVAQGAATSVLLATDTSTATARYFSNQREVRPSARSRDEKLQESFYRWSAEQVSIPPL